MIQETQTLASNNSSADGTLAEHPWVGGKGLFMVEGDFSSNGAVKLQFKTPNSTTWADVPNATFSTGNGMFKFEIPKCRVRAAIASGPVAVYAWVIGMPQ